jgi:hypothetical protein
MPEGARIARAARIIMGRGHALKLQHLPGQVIDRRAAGGVRG